MKLIELSKNGWKHKGKYFAQVDDEDYEWLMQWNWGLRRGRKTIYATRRVLKHEKNVSQATITMHQQILLMSDAEIQVDHIDHNGLNNQRSNLRQATPQQNSWNRTKRKTATSKYLGVHLYRNSQRYTKVNGVKMVYAPQVYWKASIRKDNKLIPLGYFKVEEDAARAYDAKAKDIFGEFANLNFPNE